MKMQVTSELTKEDAIEQLVSNPNCYLDLDVNCNCDAVEMEDQLTSLDYELESFKESCREHRHEIIKEKKELNKMESHEIFEKGEAMGYWKQKEKQRRLE